ncbi:radical SAM family heme chaperone HemW [Oceanobacter sp. 3_MG-2023]|uniref:radical SAM family heme chaperone HemW n=1 Tax=Oceanobacter sp. 3_MG-2023 TaxID=3062622 RepID=UPI0027356B3F|nr:radical SAM family heme chaperone HemW [Oceanobacter sp. 3_MG-2023]MDP2506936.1 radical SAM family heme chaperone HemW [Oceanobacter sp. 3_MG-2023]
MRQLPPLSLYIHVPWCIRKCPYCDFNSHTASTELPETDYVAALLNDLDSELEHRHGRVIQTIFIGGGTPSLLSAQAYASLFNGLRQRLTFADDIEITLEANPGTFEADRFAAYRALGINRLSMGIQSFNDLHLQKLGRIHDSDQAKAAITAARTAGFDNLNLDLMHGLPGQSLADAMDDLNTALSFDPPHLSWYQLTIEPNTEFYKRPPVLPEDDTLWDIQDAGQQRLADAGFAHYEISAFAQPGKQARHNLNYWQFGDYLGIGAGAHGKVSWLDSRGQIHSARRWKTRQPSDYLNPDKPFLAGSQPIAAHDMGLECLMNALRLRQGISVACFEQRTGQTLASVADPIAKAKAMGLLEVGQDIRATERGQQYLNELLGLFL